MKFSPPAAGSGELQGASPDMLHILRIIQKSIAGSSSTNSNTNHHPLISPKLTHLLNSTLSFYYSFATNTQNRGHHGGGELPLAGGTNGGRPELFTGGNLGGGVYFD
jgi:hypothetical protein